MVLLMRNWQNIYSDPPYQRYCVKRDILVTGRNIPLSCIKQYVLVFIAMAESLVGQDRETGYGGTVKKNQSAYGAGGQGIS